MASAWLFVYGCGRASEGETFKGFSPTPLFQPRAASAVHRNWYVFARSWFLARDPLLRVSARVVLFPQLSQQHLRIPHAGLHPLLQVILEWVPLARGCRPRSINWRPAASIQVTPNGLAIIAGCSLIARTLKPCPFSSSISTSFPLNIFGLPCFRVDHYKWGIFNRHYEYFRTGADSGTRSFGAGGGSSVGLRCLLVGLP